MKINILILYILVRYTFSILNLMEMERDNTLIKIFKDQKNLYRQIQNLTELVYYLDQYVIRENQ